MSKNPYLQVALTYVRRLAFWQTAPILVFLGLVVVPSSIVLIPGLSAELTALGLASLLVPLYLGLAVHLKSQFANDLAPLMPRHSYVHLAVASIVGSVVAIFIPATITWFAGLHSIGLVALALLLMSAILWTTLHLGVPGAFAIAMILPTASRFEGVRVELAQFVSGQFEMPAMGLLIVAVVVIVLTVRDLLQLDSDMPEYRATFPWGACAQRASQSRGGGAFASFRDRSEARDIDRLIRYVRRTAVSRVAKVGRWQAGLLSGGAVWRMAFGILIFGLVLVHFGWRCERRDPNAVPMVEWTALMLVVMPLSALTSAIKAARHKLTFECCLPVSRRDYIRELGLAVAWSQFQTWAILALVMVLGSRVFSPQPVTLAAIAKMLFYTAAFQIVAFAAILWLGQCRRRAHAVLFSAILVGIALAGAQIVSTRAAFWIAGAAFPLGLLIAWDAYRRWLVTDLDQNLL